MVPIPGTWIAASLFCRGNNEFDLVHCLKRPVMFPVYRYCSHDGISDNCEFTLPRGLEAVVSGLL